MAYDKGTPGQVKRVGAGLYEAGSWREEAVCYLVNLNATSCTCPDFVKRRAAKRGDCKHLRQARAAEWVRVQAIANAQPTEKLTALLPSYEAKGHLMVALAIRSELDNREAAGNPPACPHIQALREGEMQRLGLMA